MKLSTLTILNTTIALVSTYVLFNFIAAAMTYAT